MLGYWRNVFHNDGVFAPVVRHSNIRLWFGLSVKLGLAFLNDILKAIFYMEILNGLGCLNKTKFVSKISVGVNSCKILMYNAS